MWIPYEDYALFYDILGAQPTDSASTVSGGATAEEVIAVGSLTSRESEICDLIRSGLSSKQISEALSLSLATVQKHREHIRRKLGLTGRDTNLATYLRVH